MEVDLPAPLWPIRPSTSPSLRVRLTSSRAVSLPKRLPTARISITGWVIALSPPSSREGPSADGCRVRPAGAGSGTRAAPSAAPVPPGCSSDLGHGVGPDQAVHRVVGLVGDIAEAVAAEVPAQVVAPVVAAPFEGPLLLAQGHILDLGLVAHEGVAVELVVLDRKSTRLNSSH